jgi:lipopolysaccharide transport system permease protein
MVVFTLFLGGLAQVPSQRVSAVSITPYPLFVYAGLLPWLFFATAIGSAGQSLVGNQNLITKVYFPRLLIPMGAVGVGVVDFVISFGLLLVMMLCFGVVPGWGILWLPVICLGLLLAALGVGMLLSALTVAYRDFRHVLPFLVQLWMFATPSIYMQTDEMLHPRWHKVLPLNPIYGLVDGFRAAMLNDEMDFYALGVSSAVSVLLFALGCVYFRRVERHFADII